MKEIQTMSELFNSRQIIKIHGTNKLLEFNDHLSVNLYQQTEESAKMKLVPGLHSCYSKIEVAAVDYSKGTGAGNSVTVKHNLDPNVAYILAEKIIQNDIAFFQQQNGKTTGFSEEKLLYKERGNGKFAVSRFNLSYQLNMTNKWKITLEEGEAEREDGPNGNKIIKRGTYASLNKVDIYTNDVNILKVAFSLRNHLTYWETINFNTYVKARTSFEMNRKIT